jgi:hypothetical protein
VVNPSTSDWVAVFCTGGTYYWWVYATGKADDSVSLRLFANSPGSGCETLTLGYYQGGNVSFTSAPIAFAPMIQQVHLSMTSNLSNMVVDFVSSGAGRSPTCRYGASATGLSNTAAATTTLIPSIGNVSHALLTGLAPGSRVFYQCTDGIVSSPVYNFSAGAVPVAGAGAPQRVAVWADFGVNDGFSLDQIAEDAAAGAFDFALHAGDWAYNFDTGNSANGNFFMNRATLYSSFLPVQPACGNHEAGSRFGLVFGEYQARHPGVAAHSNTGSALYYSFNNGLVHYLVFNSETYIDGGIAAMLAFMAADLASVNRSATPWVVAYSHKLWWMDSTDFSKISGILQDGGVDLLFAGHWHYYEVRRAAFVMRLTHLRQLLTPPPPLPCLQRYLPYNPVAGEADHTAVSDDSFTYTNPKYVTMIVSGAPGDVERNDACPGDPSLKPITPACTSSYGYGIFTVFNASHIYWEFTAKPTPIGTTRPVFRSQASYSDHLWVVKT